MPPSSHPCIMKMVDLFNLADATYALSEQEDNLDRRAQKGAMRDLCMIAYSKR